MEPIEIIVIIISSLIVISVFSNEIRKLVKKENVCSICSRSGSRLVKLYNKKYKRRKCVNQHS